MNDDILDNGSDDHQLARQKSLEILSAMTDQSSDKDWFKKVLLPTIGKFVSQQMAPLKDEIAKLKAQVAALEEGGLRYRGVWQKANAYRRGDVVTFDGSMHVAVKDTQPAQQPLGSDVWQLCVKAGRDGPRQSTTGVGR